MAAASSVSVVERVRAGATAEVRISVTQEDIDAGEQFLCNACPIARAIVRQFPEAAWVDADGTSILMGLRRGSFLRGETPDEAHDFMCEFDEGGPSAVRPFTFSLWLAEIDARLGLTAAGDDADETDLAPVAMEDSPL